MTLPAERRREASAHVSPEPKRRRMLAKVLVIDDEKDIVSLLRYHLEKAGFQCLEGMDGAVALRLVREHHPDLLILDLMLPGMDGLEICRHLPQDVATARLPILMLPAKAEEVARVVGLEVGADDYVVKPFSPRELVARVRAILRRSPAGSQPAGRTEKFHVNHERMQIPFCNRLLKLTALEFRLLLQLVGAPG